ncbi:MAG: hypothetical protein J6Y39_06365 [Bacteroidaceae bacterium]|nr:hypothetical protein [Bacteroidaceae bacterium]
MGLFQTREPRKYRRISIYTSERQDKLDKLVRDVKREMGELPANDIEPDRFKGKFSQFTPRASQAGERENRLTWPLALILILVLILVWRYIVMGKL